MFELAPHTRPLFKQSMKVQGRALVQMLNAAVQLLVKNDVLSLTEALEDLSRRHAGYGVRPEHFDPVGRCVLFAFSMTLPDVAWTLEAQSAWITVYSVICRIMLPPLINTLRAGEGALANAEAEGEARAEAEASSRRRSRSSRAGSRSTIREGSRYRMSARALDSARSNDAAGAKDADTSGKGVMEVQRRTVHAGQQETGEAAGEAAGAVAAGAATATGE